MTLYTNFIMFISKYFQIVSFKIENYFKLMYIIMDYTVIFKKMHLLHNYIIRIISISISSNVSEFFV